MFALLYAVIVYVYCVPGHPAKCHVCLVSDRQAVDIVRGKRWVSCIFILQERKSSRTFWNSGAADMAVGQFLELRYFVWMFSSILTFLLCVLSL